MMYTDWYGKNPFEDWHFNIDNITVDTKSNREYPSTTLTLTSTGDFSVPYKREKNKATTCYDMCSDICSGIAMTCADVEYIKTQDDKTVVVRWKDGTVTHVCCEEGDKFDLYTAFCAALAKKIYGSTSAVKEVIDSHNVNAINAKKEEEKKKKREEKEKIEKINHERKIRRIAKRMREEEEAKKLIDSKNE